MNPTHAAGLRSVVNFAIPGDKTITFEHGVDGDLLILVEWFTHQRSSPPIAIWLLEDTIQSYQQCSASVRAWANVRLLKYLRSRLMVEQELRKSDRSYAPPRLEWTVLYSHMFGDVAKEPLLKPSENPPHKHARVNTTWSQAGSD